MRRGCSTRRSASAKDSRAGSARNRRTLVNANPRVEFDAAGMSRPTPAVNSAIVCPLYVGDVFIGSLALFHTEPNRYTDDHRRLIEQRRRAGRRRHPQLDRVRAGAGRLAHRSADVAAQPPLDVRAPHARTGARRAAPERGRAHRPGHRRVQARSTTPTATTSATRRCARSPTALQSALRPYDSVRALRRRRVHRRHLGLLARDRRSASGGSCRSASARSRSKCAPGQRIRLGASAGAAVFPHDGATYEALLADADRRMYRDKSTRRSAGEPASAGLTPARHDMDALPHVGSRTRITGARLIRREHKITESQ